MMDIVLLIPDMVLEQATMLHLINKAPYVSLKSLID
jgi:hypothetical protein